MNRLEYTDLRLANAEIAKLRRQLGQSGRVHKRVERAYRDALLLANFHIGYLPTTRAAAERYAQMSNNRWENAIALLKMARVYQGRGRWVVHTLAEIEPALQRAAGLALEHPERYYARLPVHARPADN